MRLSTKGHYGFHAMLELASRFGQGPVLLRELCETHGFSEKYLEQLLRSLRQAGLVESVRGARGGYWLSRPAEEITLLEIMEALEGDLIQPPSKCKNECHLHGRCALFAAWQEAMTAMRQVMAKTTLAELLQRQKEMNQKKGVPDYAI